MELINFLKVNDLSAKNKILKQENRTLYEEFLSKTLFLDERYNEIPFNQRRWHILNNDFEYNRCISCDNVTKWNKKKLQYSISCSRKCELQYRNTEKFKEKFSKNFSSDSEKLKKMREKTLLTNMKKYGVSNVMQLESSKLKTRETNIKRFGVDHPMKLDDHREIREKTNMKKYGTKNVMQHDVIKEKQKNTIIERYGVDNVTKLPEIIKNRKKTCLEKYSVEHPFQSDIVKEKICNTNLKKYGFKNATQNEIVKEKICNTNLKKYGVKDYSQTGEYKIKHSNKIYLNFIEIFKRDGYEEMGYKIIENLRNSTYKIFCLHCNNNFILETQNIYYSRKNNHQEICTLCNPINKLFSSTEKELLSFIKEIYSGEVVENNRLAIRPYEIDIFLPELNLAIEYNGDYWHANPKFYKSTDRIIGGKKELLAENIWEKDNHKKILCKEKNIELITIWETDWINRKETVKRYLKITLQRFSS